jgi:hypothetical protein
MKRRVTSIRDSLVRRLVRSQVGCLVCHVLHCVLHRVLCLRRLSPT